MHGIRVDIETLDVNIAWLREVADRRLLGADTLLATIDNPAQYAQIFAETGPEKPAIGILPEPVDVEDSWQLVGTFGERQPVRPVVCEVVAAKRFHCHRVAADNAYFTDIRCRRF